MVIKREKCYINAVHLTSIVRSRQPGPPFYSQFPVASSGKSHTAVKPGGSVTCQMGSHDDRKLTFSAFHCKNIGGLYITVYVPMFQQAGHENLDFVKTTTVASKGCWLDPGAFSPHAKVSPGRTLRPKSLLMAVTSEVQM